MNESQKAVIQPESSRLLTEGIPKWDSSIKILRQKDIRRTSPKKIFTALSGGGKKAVHIFLSIPHVAYYSTEGEDTGLARYISPVFNNADLTEPHGGKLYIERRDLLLNMLNFLNLQPDQIFGAYLRYFNYDVDTWVKLEGGVYQIADTYWMEVLSALKKDKFITAAVNPVEYTGDLISSDNPFKLFRGNIFLSRDNPGEHFFTKS